MDGTMPHVDRNDASRAHDGNPIAIVIVDDDSQSRVLLGRFFEALGYDVRIAGNGQEALLLLAAPCALVLSDVEMPVMGGVALLREVRARGGSMTFALMSSLPAEVVRARLQQADRCDHVFTKPLDLDVLEEVITGTDFGSAGRRT
jgi:CheY-like chemotaxis protein